MKTSSRLYHGKIRNTPGPTVVVDDADTFGRILRFEGTAIIFRWGTNASASELETLARAILSDLLDGDFSQDQALEFARDVIADLPESGFTIADWQVEAWLEARTAKR